jgi:hypothetical protein
MRLAMGISQHKHHVGFMRAIRDAFNIPDRSSSLDFT